MSLKLNSSGGGSVTLQEPATASNVTLNLPAANATLLTNSGTQTVAGVIASSSGGFQFPDNSTQNTAATGFGFKNRIINGQMSIWQRGTTFSCAVSNVTYTADRWAVFPLGAAVTVDRVANNLTSRGFYALRVTGAAGNTRANLLQRIESLNAITLQGLACKVSFSAVASTNMTLSWSSEYANTQDNFAATTTISSGTISVTTTPTRFELDIAANNNTFNGVVFTIGANSGLGAGQSFTITDVQYESGSTATSFDYRPYGTELMLCQRYYTRLTGSGPFGAFGNGVVVSSSQANGVIVRLPVAMRTQPTTAISNCRIYDGAGASAVTGISGASATDACTTTSLGFDLTCSGTVLTAFRPAIFQGNNNVNAYVEASAEL